MGCIALATHTQDFRQCHPHVPALEPSRFFRPRINTTCLEKPQSCLLSFGVPTMHLTQPTLTRTGLLATLPATARLGLAWATPRPADDKAPNTLTDEEIAADWKFLFNGK